MTESDGSKPAPAGIAKKPTAAAVPTGKTSASGEPEGEEQESRAAWIMGWVVGPGAVLGTIFLGGLLVGVHYHDSWISRFVMWTVGLFS